jgi:hypothetical protein
MIDHPGDERPDAGQVVVARLGRQLPKPPLLGQPRGHAGGVDVPDPSEAATVEDRLDAGPGLPGVFVGRPFGPDKADVVFQVVNGGAVPV